MNATTLSYQTVKLTEAVKEIHATLTPIAGTGSYSIARGGTCCKATPTNDSIIIDCAQGMLEVTQDSAPNIRTALNIGLIRPLLDQVCANTCWVVRPYRRSDTWEIVDSQNREVTVEVAMGGSYREPELCIGGSSRDVKVLTVPNLKQHINKAMNKARANVKWHADRKANEAEEQEVKNLLKCGINSERVVSTKERDIHFDTGYNATEGTTGGNWDVTIAYKNTLTGIEAKIKITTSLEHAYAAGIILAKRIQKLDQV